MADLVFNFKIKQMAEIFDEDRELKEILVNNYFYTPDVSVQAINPLRINQYEELAEILLAEYDYISNMEIANLWKLKFRVPEIERIFNRPYSINISVYNQIMYSFKFGSVKHFFKDNYYKFLPSMDASAIDSTQKMKMFSEAFMKEFDRFSDIIDEMNNITDVDKVGNDYLGYLVQMLGYEKGDDKLLGKDSFRELAKNMIEVYRIKGTNYSFELFFNFLGFEVILDEFWFDRRYADEGYSVNPYTGSKQLHAFEYYLTPIKPTEYIPKRCVNRQVVMDNEITDIRSHLWFEKKVSQGYPVMRLLGLDEDGIEPEEGFDFTYFKTNIIQYSIKRIRSKETDADELSADDEKVIQMYSDFLTPIFIHKRIQISISPFEDTGESLTFSDMSIFNTNLQTYENLFKLKSDLHLYDKWVDNPFLPSDEGGNFPLVFTEEVDVGDYETGGINNEEPREFFIRLNTNQEGVDGNPLAGGFTQDKFTNFFDDGDITSDEDGNELEFNSMKCLRVFTETIPNNNNSLSPESGDMLSLWDYFHLNDIEPNLGLVVDIIPVDEDSHRLNQDTLGKITNFQEDMFNRVHRLEQLDVMDRDYWDWDDFNQIRAIPKFSDTGLSMMRMSNFYTVNISYNLEAYYSVDDEVNTTPWLFYDTFTILRETF